MGIFSSSMNILLMILGFGLLIFVHELGHFLAAKWAKIRTEGFAIGMGPVLCAWRKGIGFRFGSTEREYLRRAEAHMRTVGDKVELTRERVYDAADAIGLGETEYSLRILPIGGFVKMLGQEDANPAATSTDARSYNQCPVGKRMIVVSAGVIMNMIFAALLFMIIFSVGVPFDAAVVGNVVPGRPAAVAVAENSKELEARGIDPVGLRPADRVVSIDGDAAETFPDIQIASAMSKPDARLAFVVERPGIEETLRFLIEPETDRVTGLRTVGIVPPNITTIESQAFQAEIREQLELLGLEKQGIVPGSTLMSVNGHAIQIIQQMHAMADASGGEPLKSTWETPDGSVIDVELPVMPEFQQLPTPVPAEDGRRDEEQGLLGFVPPTVITAVMEDSPNFELLRAGDIVAMVEENRWPRRAEMTGTLRVNNGEEVAMRVLRGGEYVDLTLKVRRDGTIGVQIRYATDTALIANAMPSIGVRDEDDLNEWSSRDTPLFDGDVIAGSEVLSVGLVQDGDSSVREIDAHRVNDWTDFREGLQKATRDAFEVGTGASVYVALRAPNAEAEQETLTLALTVEDVRELHELGWDVAIPDVIFARMMTVRSSEGNPLQALAMGVDETWKIMIQTYQTIDRLFRGTIGADQLRGPVGIVHLGYQLADRGLLYMLFLLAAVSVNLAVINFLPLPIVDGGLFLFLVYERFKGRPPSIAFQNIATLAGLGLIISVFLYVTWNDVVRLVG